MLQTKEVVTKQHIDKLSQELAKAAGINADQAHKVLQVLHIDKLNENMVAMQEILQNPKAVNALGMSHSDASQRLEIVRGGGISLENLRVGLKPAGLSGIMV